MTDLDTIESIDLYEYCGGLYSATRSADGWVHNMLAAGELDSASDVLAVLEDAESGEPVTVRVDSRGLLFI